MLRPGGRNIVQHVYTFLRLYRKKWMTEQLGYRIGEYYDADITASNYHPCVAVEIPKLGGGSLRCVLLIP